VNIYPTSFDTQSGGLNFHGAYDSIKTWGPRTTVERYILVKTMPRVPSQQGIYGTETEITPGVRVSDNVPGGFDYILDGTLQRGYYLRALSDELVIGSRDGAAARLGLPRTTLISRMQKLGLTCSAKEASSSSLMRSAQSVFPGRPLLVQ